jgi:hypothetical protein
LSKKVALQRIIVFLAFWLLIITIITPSFAATVTYQYSGQHFDTFSPGSSYDSSNSISGSFTLDLSDLGSNLNLSYDNYTSDVSTASFTDGEQTISSIANISFATDDQGDITTWLMIFTDSTFIPRIETYNTSSSKLDAGVLTSINWGSNSGNPGNWNVVPIPGAVWLLGSGLVGLVGLRRKFRK